MSGEMAMMTNNAPPNNSRDTVRGLRWLAESKIVERANPLHPIVLHALRALACRMMKALDADLCAIFGWDPGQKRLVFVQAFDKHEAPMAPWNGYATTLVASPAMHSALENGLSVILRRGHGAKAMAAERVLQHFGCHSLVLVPIGWEEDKIAVIALLLSSQQVQLNEQVARLLDLLATYGLAQIKESLHQARGRLVEASKGNGHWCSSQGDSLLGAVSRDLRLPLGRIMNLAELIRAGNCGELSDEAAQHLDRVLQGASMLMETVNELATWGRSGSRQLKFYPEWIAMPELVEMAQKVAQTTIAAVKGSGGTPVAVTASSSGELPPVFVDVARLRQVVSNLVATLLNVTPAAQLHINAQLISVKDGQVADVELPRPPQLAKGQWVVLSVGCPDSDIPRDLFQQLVKVCLQPSGQETSWPEGALGLIIAKRLMLLHGSMVWIMTQEPSAASVVELQAVAHPVLGLTFALALPVHPQQVWIGRHQQVTRLSAKPWKQAWSRLISDVGGTANVLTPVYA